MIISIVNFASIPDSEVQSVLRSINRQITEDFAPYWSMGATLRLEGRAGSRPTVKKALPTELRGDAIIYLWDKADVADAIGYHDANFAGLPFGFVFTQISKALGEPWSVTLSHEALELIGDASANVFAAGPHPAHPDRLVFHWYEMCDAVQAETYEIDSVPVSNFVLPLYFTIDNETGSRNDFLGTRTMNSSLASFGVNPGGYVGFYDPSLKQHDTYTLAHDQVAAFRMKEKSAAKIARRSNRYRSLSAGGDWQEQLLSARKTVVLQPAARAVKPAAMSKQPKRGRRPRAGAS
ncbi:MAG TPA: hypothetical protein VFD82_06440 [Planctomycetota bacterium]|nr:hypothetical protein [Planctomycetota bacterium]